MYIFITKLTKFCPPLTREKNLLAVVAFLRIELKRFKWHFRQSKPPCFMF